MFNDPSTSSNINVNIGNKVFKITSNTDDKETKYSWNDKFLDSEIKNYFRNKDFGVKDMSKLITAVQKYDEIDGIKNNFSEAEFNAVIEEAGKNNAEDLGLAKINYQPKKIGQKWNGNYKPDWTKEGGVDNYDAGKWNSKGLGNYRYLPTIEDVKDIVDADKMKEMANLSNSVAKSINKQGECYGGFKKVMENEKIFPDIKFQGGRAFTAAVTLEQHPELFEEIYVPSNKIQNLPAGFILVYDDANGAVSDKKGSYCGHVGITTTKNPNGDFKFLGKPNKEGKMVYEIGYEGSSVVGVITNPDNDHSYGRYRVFVPKKQTPATETPQTIALSEEAPKIN